MNINKGKTIKHQRIVIYGVEGIGKTELATHFPNPIFIDTEGSTDHLDVSRTDTPTSWPMLIEQINWFGTNPHEYQTLVIDTIDWAERLAVKQICMNGNVNGIEDFGWGKGFTYVAEEIGRFLDLLTHVSKRMNIVLLAHCHIKGVNLPEETGQFDKYELRMEKKSAPLPKEWADAVFFANYKTYLSGEGAKKKATGGRRTLFTSHTTAHDAKNRYGLPSEIDFEGKPEIVYQSISNFIPTTQSQVVKNEAETIQEEAQTSQPEVEETGDTNQEQTTEKSSTAFSGPLYDLMNSNNVEDKDIENLAVRSGHFPEGMKFGDYPQDYLDHLVANWENVIKSIKENK